MKLTTKQKRAIEKVTGKNWDFFPIHELEVYFNYTDRGIQGEANELIIVHRHHAVTVEMWKQDFKRGLLFLSDFLNGDYPDAYISHAFEIYEKALGYVPSCYCNHPRTPSKYRREIDRTK